MLLSFHRKLWPNADALQRPGDDCTSGKLSMTGRLIFRCQRYLSPRPSIVRHYRRCALFGEPQRQQQYPCIRGILRLYHHVQ